MSSLSPVQILSVSYTARWWSFIPSVRGILESYCGHSTGSAEFSERVGVTVHELLENAVKYSANPDGLVHCSVDLRDGRLAVQVDNMARPEHIDCLRREYDTVSSGNPLEVYIEKMASDIDGGSSQLGLARIRYEGEAELLLSIENDRVKLEALFEMPDEVTAA